MDVAQTPLATGSGVQRSNTGGMARGKFGKLGSACILCGVCSVVTLAIMIPVSIFVIAPHVAQHLFDGTQISLRNMTQLACGGGQVSANRTQLYNAVTLKVPGFGPIGLPTTILPFTQEVYTTGCIDPYSGQPTGPITFGGSYACNDTAEFRIGSYSSPQMSVVSGKTNFVNFSAVLDHNQTIAAYVWTFGVAVNPFRKARLLLRAKDVSVKVLGVTIKGLTLNNELTCTAVCPEGDFGLECPSKPISNSVCYPDRPKHDPDSSPAMHMVCEFGAHSLTGTPTTTITPSSRMSAPTPNLGDISFLAQRQSSFLGQDW